MLNVDALRKNLAARRRAELTIEGFTRSAVLVPVLSVEGKDHLLFTRRTQTVEHHKGQISFPGGRLDDGESLADCALRETHEEVGVPAAAVRLLGALDDIWTPTGYVVTPFVGLVPYPWDFRLSAAEIEQLLIVPVSDLLDPSIYEETQIDYQDRSAIVPYYHWGEHTIWGATGRIVRQFLALGYPGKDPTCGAS
jgi:8-oxo-dGTP pyrophosphatase MutT (NUDIX family)